MNKDFIIDYCSCILVRALGPLIRLLPLNTGLFLGRRLGELFYYIDAKHKTIAYSNLKTALGSKLRPSQLTGLTKDFYRAFGQNIIEIFFIPLVNKEYFTKYISFEGLDYISEGFKKGKGVILLAMHEGSWELSNIICAFLGFPFNLFVRQQRFPRLNSLLNSYRAQKGCRLIQRQNQLRKMLEVLKDNQAIGMTLDQGGKDGTLVKFFGKNASMSIGAVKLALKYDTALIPVFYTRVCGPYIKVIIGEPFELKKTGNQEKDIRDNLQELVSVFERNILRYPQEYLWTYKVWKYTNEKNLLILSDCKTGHLRQSEAASYLIRDYFKEKGIKVNIDTQEIRFKSKFHRLLLNLNASLTGEYHCYGSFRGLRQSLQTGTYNSLVRLKPDIVISCGSSLAAVNLVMAYENMAKSVVIMRPQFLSTKKFDLAIVPRHDSPSCRKNAAVTEGALNLITEGYLKEQTEKLMLATGHRLQATGFYIGVLIGGDTKDSSFSKDAASEVIKQIKLAAEKLNADILLTTSRRTSKEVEQLIKQELKDCIRCKFLIIANEKNIPAAVGGILGLSAIIVSSSESISMISEAANSRKYVLVFDTSTASKSYPSGQGLKTPLSINPERSRRIDSQEQGMAKRHKRFLEHFEKNKYIYLVPVSDLGRKIEEIWLNKPEIHTLRDNHLVSEAIIRIL